MKQTATSIRTILFVPWRTAEPENKQKENWFSMHDEAAVDS